jgi:hypothetical protein
MGLVNVNASHARIEGCETRTKGATESRSGSGYDNILRLPVLMHHCERYVRKVERGGHSEYDRIVAFEKLAGR